MRSLEKERIKDSNFLDCQPPIIVEVGLEVCALLLQSCSRLHEHTRLNTSWLDISKRPQAFSIFSWRMPLSVIASAAITSLQDNRDGLLELPYMNLHDSLQFHQAPMNSPTLRLANQHRYTR